MDDPTYARSIAKALMRGGLKTLEVKLRAPAGIEVIQEMRLVERVCVGADTFLNVADTSRAPGA